MEALHSPSIAALEAPVGGGKGGRKRGARGAGAGGVADEAAARLADISLQPPTEAAASSAAPTAEWALAVPPHEGEENVGKAARGKAKAAPAPAGPAPARARSGKKA